MLSIVFIGALLLSGYYNQKWILLHKKSYYVFVSLLAILSLFFSNFPLAIIIQKGFLGFSYIYVVMIVGILPKKWSLQKRMVPVRQVYSIAGFLLITAHVVFTLTHRNTLGLSIDPFGVFSYLIMIPLFITSFKNINSFRLFMKWKKLQRFAYLAYLFLFIHLLKTADAPNIYMYYVLFIPYFVVRPYKLLKYDIPSMKLKLKLLKK